MHGIRDSIRDFVFENDLPCLELNFDNVLMEPEKTIGQLNDFLGCQLTVDDLKAIYHGELYRKPRDTKDLVKAGLIYLKNYGERYR